MRVGVRGVLSAGFLLTVIGCGQPLFPQQAIDDYVRAQLLVDRGNDDDALVALTRAVQADPTLSVAYESMGDIHRRRGSYELARRAYETACRLNPYDFRPHYNLGVTYQALAEAARDDDQAEKYLRKATYIYLRAITIKPDDFEGNLNLSACYFQAGKYDLAEQYCRAAIKANPTNPQAYSNMGIIFDSQNRLYEAVKSYKKSLELDVNQPQVLLNLAATYVRQNRLKKAVHTYTLAAGAMPNSGEPWERMGACYFHMRNIPKAKEAYEKAISLNSDNAAAHRGLGAVYMSEFLLDRTGNREALREKALKQWNASLEIDPNQPELLKLVRKYSPKYLGPKL